MKKTIQRFIAKLTTLAIVLGMVIPFYNVAHADLRATLRLNTNLSEGSYTLKKTVLPNGLTGSGTDVTTFYLSVDPAGTEFEVIYDSINGYDEPTTLTFTLFDGDDISYTTAEGNGVYRVEGDTDLRATVNLQTNLDEGSYTLKKLGMANGLTGSGTVLNPFNVIVEQGGTDFVVDYDTVTGFTTPSYYQFTLYPNDNVTFGINEGIGVYLPIGALPTGRAWVSTNIAEGSYEIQDNGVLARIGGGVNPQAFNLETAAGAVTTYTIVYDDAPGYTKPADFDIDISEGSDDAYGPYMGLANRTGIYVPVLQGEQEDVNIRTNLLNGSYLIYKDGVAINSGSGDTYSTFPLESSASGVDYSIAFDEIGGGLIAPAQIDFTLYTNTTVPQYFTGLYHMNSSAGSISVTVVNEYDVVIQNGNWELRLCTDLTPATCGDLGDSNDPAVVASGGVGTVVPDAAVGIYRMFANDAAAYEPGTQVVLPANENPYFLTANYNKSFIIKYFDVIPVGQDPMLQSKTVDNTAPLTGDDVTYTVNYENLGDTTATAVSITDDYEQASMTFVSSPDCTDDGDVLTCDLGDLAPGVTGSVSYVMNVTATAGTVVNNTAAIANAGDVDLTNNTASATLTVAVTPVNSDPVIFSKSSPAVDPLPGELIWYFINYGNIGADAATNTVITDDYDETVITVDAALLDSRCTDDGDVLTCNLGTLASSDSGTVIYSAFVNATATPGASIVNTATIDADSNTSAINDADSSTLTVGTPPVNADPSINNKLVSNAGALPNEVISYTINYANLGLADATTVVISDNYDQANLSNIVLGDPVNCSDDGDIITCNLGTLTAGATGSVLYSAQVNLATSPGTFIVNTATISADVNVNITNDLGVVTVNVGTPVAGEDPTITSKVVDNTAPFTGDDVTYRVYFANLGDTTATAVTITDDYDQTAMTFVSSADCTDDGDVLTCDLGDLSIGATGYVEYIMNVTAAGGTVVGNTATIANANDVDLTNNVGNASLTVSLLVVGEDPMIQSKVADNNAPLTTTDVTYQVNYANNGDTTATAVTITDDFDETAMAFVSSPDCTDSVPTGVLTCDLGDLASAATGSVSYVMNVTAGGGTVVGNTATIANTGDVDLTNNTGIESVTVSAVVGEDPMVQSKTVDNTAPLTGQDVTYTVNYANIGDTTATTVSITDDFDETAMTFVSSPDCTDSVPTGVLTCDLVDLTSGATGSVTYVMNITAAAGTVVGNTATIANVGDVDLTNNDGVATLTVAATVPGEDPMVQSKTVDNAAPVTGDDVTYTVNYANLGDTTATAVTITDDFDETAMTFVSSPDCTDSVPTGVLTCDLGDLASTATSSLTYVMNVTAVAGTVVGNTAAISNANDVDLTNNDGVATLTVAALVAGEDPSVQSKTVDLIAPLTGQDVTYTVNYSNLGDTLATAVSITDDFDETAMTFVSSANCTDSVPTGVLTCDLGDVASAASGSVTYVMNVTAAAGTVVGNTATIANAGDVDLTNNDGAATLTVAGLVAGEDPMVQSKTVDNAAPATGDDVTYTVNYANLGDTLATAVTITDDFDETAMAFVSSPDCTDSVPTGVLTCDLGDVASAATGSVSYVMNATAASGTVVNNTATIANVGDVDLTNNDGVATLTVTTPVTPTLITVTTADDANGPATGVSGADIFLEDLDAGTGAQLIGTQQVIDYAVAPGTNYRITFSTHPTDNTYTDPLPIDFNLVMGATRSMVGTYVHSCLVELYQQDNTLTAIAGEVYMSVNGGPEFFYGTGDPANNYQVQINIDETQTNVIRFAAPVPNPNNVLVPTPDTITIGPSAPGTCPAAPFTTVYSSPDPDLTVTHVAGVTDANEGDTVSYTVNYGNDGALGTGDATTAVLTINVDANMGNIANVVGTGCATAGNTITCNLGDLTYGTTGTITYDADVNMGVSGVAVVNTATISATEADANTADNTASSSVGAGIPEVTLVKTVTPATLSNGQFATYTITLTRTNTTIAGALNFTVSDSFTGNSVLNGNNGGTMEFELNSGSCTALGCSGTQIDVAAIDVSLGSTLGDTAVITYRARANYSGIPNGQTSAITNIQATATGTGSAAALGVLSAAVDTTVNGPALIITPPSGPVSTSGGGGGGGGSGGGYIYMTGDMELDIRKLVSLDGVNYFENSEGAVLKVTVPENKTTTLFNKVIIKNLGRVSATNIKFRHTFDQGRSDMTANELVDNLVGASFSNNLIKVEKVKVGEEYVFTYSVNIHENGQNSNPATDGLELVDYGSSLTSIQDGLTYLGIGSLSQTYIYAGNSATIAAGTSVSTGGTGSGGTTGGSSTVARSPAMDIKVSTDKASAKIGETVNFTVTLENITDADLTNLFISHDYTNTIEIVSAPGAQNDSEELSWKRTVLRPGSSVTLRFSVKVLGNAPVGETVKSLTRVLVNEFEGITPAEYHLRILEGAAQVEPDRPYDLAATGPIGMTLLLMILSSLGYFGAGMARNQMFLRKKKLALAGI